MPQLTDDRIPQNYKNSFYTHYSRQQNHDGIKKFLAISFIALLIFPIIMMIHKYACFIIKNYPWIGHLIALWTVAVIIYELAKRRK